MKDYDVMVEITIAKTITVTAPDPDTAQVNAKLNIEAQFERLSYDYYNSGQDDLIVDIGDATESE